MSQTPRQKKKDQWKITESTKEWIEEMFKVKEEMEKDELKNDFLKSVTTTEDGNETDKINDTDIDEVSSDSMTITLNVPDQTERQEAEGVMPTLSEFSLNSDDFGRLDIQPLNINVNFPGNVVDWANEMVDKALEDEDDAQKWKDLLDEEAESVEVIIPKVVWSDCDSDGLFSDDDDDDIDLMDYIKPISSRKVKKIEDSGKGIDINPITGRKRVKIVDSDEESDDETDNKLVQLAPRVEVDLTEEVKKAKADLEGTTDESKTKKARQVTRWCFTMNNPLISGEDLAEKLKKTENVKGFVFQLEEGANGTEHFQGYVELKRSERMTKVKELIGENPHMEAAEGNKESNLKYCTKEEGRKEGPWIWGTCTEKKGQGKRTDLDDFARAVFEAGEVTEEIEEMFPGHAMQFARQAKAISADRALREAKKAQKEYWMQVVKDEEEGKKTQGQLQIHNRLFFGPTAVGKTTMVMKMTMGKGHDLYTKAGWNKWFEGYKKEKHMLVDEFGTGFCDGKIENFNAMNNIGVNVQEVKGSHVLLHVTHAYFTTNRHPLHIWDEVKESGTYKAFVRRFAEVYWWNDKHELVILKNPGSKDEADDEAQWKKDYTRWMSFWNGKQLDDEHRTIVPGQTVKNYFTFGCNQPQTDIRSMF